MSPDMVATPGMLRFAVVVLVIVLAVGAADWLRARLTRHENPDIPVDSQKGAHR